MGDLDTRFGSFGEGVTKLWTPLERRGIFLLFSPPPLCGKMECGAALGIKIIGEWGFGSRRSVVIPVGDTIGQGFF